MLRKTSWNAQESEKEKQWIFFRSIRILIMLRVKAIPMKDGLYHGDFEENFYFSF